MSLEDRHWPSLCIIAVVVRSAVVVVVCAEATPVINAVLSNAAAKYFVIIVSSKTVNPTNALPRFWFHRGNAVVRNPCGRVWSKGSWNSAIAVESSRGSDLLLGHQSLAWSDSVHLNRIAAASTFGSLIVNPPFSCGWLSNHFLTSLLPTQHSGSACPVGAGRGCGDAASAGWRCDRHPYGNLTRRHRWFPTLSP